MIVLKTMQKGKIFLIAFWLVTLMSCTLAGQQKSEQVTLTPPAKKAVAAFAEGCFWCSEHIFEEVAGVDSAVSGYAGGHLANPTYEQVCSETTGHAETVLVYYDPSVVSYKDLLDVFFSSHDPTTMNRQGPDEGSSYRSVIFYSNKAEEELAYEAVKKWQPSFKMPIVSQVVPLKKFYRAEEYHQNYAASNPLNSYIRNVSMPRFQEFKRQCKLKLKEN
jgi:peptide-methionine (S)-S-oxide reductase